MVTNVTVVPWNRWSKTYQNGKANNLGMSLQT